MDNTFIADVPVNLIAPEMPLIAENYTDDIRPAAFIRYSMTNVDESEMITKFFEIILASSVALTDHTFKTLLNLELWTFQCTL